MRDIIERLRERRLDSECIDPGSYCCGSDCECQLEDIEEAADEIERLRAALHECARYLEEQVSASYWHIEQPFDANTQRRYDRDMARAHKAFAALGEKE